MNLEKDKFYTLQDVSGKKWGTSSFAAMQLFRPFAEAAARKGAEAIPVQQVAGATLGAVAVEFCVSKDMSHAETTKALQEASEKLGRTLAIKQS